MLTVVELPAAAELLGAMNGCRPDLSSLCMKVIFLVQFKYKVCHRILLIKTYIECHVFLFCCIEPRRSAVVRLGAAMTVECGKSRITASFPANLIRELGVTRLTLNDASCVSQSNGTHVVLSSLITSCGSTGDSDGKVVSTTNFVSTM